VKDRNEGVQPDGWGIRGEKLDPKSMNFH
jgi:hypothetical protein